jgi:hypothetical protein
MSSDNKPRSIIDILFEKGAIDVNELIKSFDRLKSDRSGWESKWNMIQEQVFPNYRDYQSPRTQSAWQPRTDRIRNHSSVVSGKINKVVSQINSQLTDPSVKWLDIKFNDPSYLSNGMQLPLSQFDAANRWLYKVKESLYNLFSDPESNFYPSTYSFHFDWFTIGTACREIILRKDTNRIRFNTISMQDVYVETSGYGDIDVIYRRFMLTAKQAYDLWGDRIHESQMSLLGSEVGNNRNRLHEYIEVSKKNPLAERIPSPAYMTCVIDKRNKHIVDVSLHYQHPYIVARFNIAPNEIYGRTYVWEAMPDILIINRLTKRAVQSADYAVSPPILVKNAADVVQAQLTPNSFIQGLDGNGRPTMVPMNIGGDFQTLMAFYQSKLNDLDEALVARDIFAPESPNMTATEVNERKIQAANRLRPILVRLEHEDLNKTIRRSISLLSETGQIPLFPYEEIGKQLQMPEGMLQQLMPDPVSQIKIRFSGQMAKMQRLQDIQNSEMLLQKTLQAAQIDQTVLDRINLDELIVTDAEIYDVNPRVINPEEVVRQIREQRSQQQAAQAEQQEAQAQVQNEALAIENILKAKEAGIDVPTN